MDEPARDPESGPAPMSLRRTLGMAAGGPGSSRLAAWRRRGAWPAALSLAAVALLGGYQGISGAMGSQGVSMPILPSSSAPSADAVAPTPSVAPPVAGAAGPTSVPGSELGTAPVTPWPSPRPRASGGSPAPRNPSPGGSPTASGDDDHGGRSGSSGGGDDSGGEDHSGSGNSGGNDDGSGPG